jgi:hypothetical protein
MEPIVIHLPNKKVPQKPKEEPLLARCKYFHGEEENPYKDTSSAEACFWDIERIAVRESEHEKSEFLDAAKEELERVKLPKELTDEIPEPVIQVAFVKYGFQCSAAYMSPEFKTGFETFLKMGYGLNLV